MEVRITFRSELFIQGDSLEEVRSKWENMELFSEEANAAGACEIELVSVEDENYNDIMSEF
jgi:hypothetical protein